MWINSINHTNLKVASDLAPRHFISTDASSFFPLSVCFLFSSGGKKKNHQTLYGGFLRQSTDTLLLSAWRTFVIDQHPQFALFPGPHHSVFCTLSLYWLLHTLIVCLNSVLSCYKGRRLALGNPYGAELLCSIVFCAGYREAFAWFISEFGAVACHCKCQRTGHKGTGGAGGVKTNWFVFFLCSMRFWWGPCKQAHEIQSLRGLAGLSYLHKSWKQHSFLQFQWRWDRAFCHSKQATVWRKCLEVQWISLSN